MSFVVTNIVTTISDIATVVAEMETAIELVDGAKTIFLYDIKKVGSGFQGVIVHGT